MSRAAHDTYHEGMRARLVQVLAAILAASVLAMAAAAIAAFDRAVEPELANRTRLIGSIVRMEIQRALELSIPLRSMAGLDLYLTEMLDKFPEVERIAVVDVSGETIAAVDRPKSEPSLFEGTTFGVGTALGQNAFVLPIIDGNRLVGKISVEISPVFVQTRLRDVFLDVIVITLVATLVALELTLAVTVTSVGKPLDRVLRLLSEQRDGNFLHRIRAGGLGGLARAAERLNDHAEDLAERLSALPAAVRSRTLATLDARIADGRPVRLQLSDIGDIRLALFLFSVATEVAAAFLPLYARAATRPEWLSAELAAAAPLVFYLVAIAALSPFAGPLARRFGARRIFLISIPPTILALAAMGFSGSVAEIAFWRGLMAVFYATATIACQEYAIRAAAARGSSRPLGTFITVIYGGVFCGSALGGVVAGRFGFEATFLLGAVIAGLSGILGFFAMRGAAGDAHRAAVLPAETSGPRTLNGPRFMTLLLGIAVPMNAATAAFIWYLTPMILAGGGSGPAEIARVVMLYYLAAVLFGSKVSSLSDGRTGPLALVLVGALASGAALLSLSYWTGFWAIIVAVAGLGISHALMRAPLYSLAFKISGGSSACFNTLRLAERIGAIIGLAATSFLLGDVGGELSVLVLGMTVLSGLVLFSGVETINRLRGR